MLRPKMLLLAGLALALLVATSGADVDVVSWTMGACLLRASCAAASVGERLGEVAPRALYRTAALGRPSQCTSLTL